MPLQRRARKDEDKQERRQAILDLAWQIFQDSPYDAITMAGVAERAGLAKGTLYLYFKTKEELFLVVEEQQLEEWFVYVDTQLDTLLAESDLPPNQPEANINRVVDMMVGTLRERPGMARLLAMLPGVLEHNIDFETAHRFKAWLLEGMLQTGPRLERCLPFLLPGQGARLMLWLHALVIGFMQMTDVSPVVRKVLDQPDLRSLDIDFITEFSETFRLMLNGLASERGRTENGQ